MTQEKKYLISGVDLPKPIPRRTLPPLKKENNIGRNDLCPCNSGIKYKKCCINK